MDGFEHLLGSRDLLIRLLESAPGLKIVVTSRLRLGMQCEQTYRIWRSWQVLAQVRRNSSIRQPLPGLHATLASQAGQRGAVGQG